MIFAASVYLSVTMRTVCPTQRGEKERHVGNSGTVTAAASAHSGSFSYPFRTEGKGPGTA